MTEKELVAGRDYFKDSFDTFGFEETNFGINQVKEKLKGLLSGGYIETFTDMELWQLFSTAGLLNNHSKYASVFDKLPSMPRTQKEIALLKKWANDPNDTSVPFGDASSDDETTIEDIGETEIPSGGTGETGDSTENDDPFDYDDSEHGKYNLEKKLASIFLNGEKLESFVDDPEKIKFFENSQIKKYWNEAFKIDDAKPIVDFIKKKGITNNAFTDTISKRFLDEYEGTMEVYQRLMRICCDYLAIQLLKIIAITPSQ